MLIFHSRSIKEVMPLNSGFRVSAPLRSAPHGMTNLAGRSPFTNSTSETGSNLIIGYNN